MFAILIILYLITSVVNYGGVFAYSQRNWELIADNDYRKDMIFSICVSLIPIAGFIAGAYMTELYKHGFKFK